MNIWGLFSLLFSSIKIPSKIVNDSMCEESVSCIIDINQYTNHVSCCVVSKVYTFNYTELASEIQQVPYELC